MAQQPSAKELADAFKEIDSWDLVLFQNMGQSTAQLMDENEPDGGVVIRDERGNDRLYMPRDVWDELRRNRP